MTHPKLVAALQDYRSGKNLLAIVGIALRTKLDADDRGTWDEYPA